ncbi:MAG: acetyl-CoA carboxylase biotin carboxyl carrier protein [Polyangiaceae bacterium]|nr:acetyl-CoA carboxylase biotin carboxyl carrier protein [Polyangiaceae bacterium]
MTVDIDKLRTLLEVLKEENVAEFEHETEGTRVRIVRGSGRVLTADAFAAAGSPAVLSAPLVPLAPLAAAPTLSAQIPSDVVDVTSPFVGTFYHAPSPDAPPFVQVGSVVRPGQTLCIIEAMKLMNEIEAEVSGTIIEILEQNGKPVEYGQKLYRVKKA